ncbi:uncharacterized protein LOC119775971 [Cyprinodon tularosa]|uniref:uncharacterized protein LOC119775971 n=1 Tax=Cyprinodon tularosa TaxID=77115 RepID=UPI0018E233BF|nr:uncharacterized protein LOC119775971 [Cyprinodon tularosa]XP_038130096.1 uncharacterized protein LOC119775971 [Cyprinodon tularosa]
MPSFGFLDELEHYFRTGKFGENTSKSLKRGIHNASKRFIYKDGLLWRPYRGRLLRVVRSDKEIQEIMTRYHNDNNHAGRERVVREIMMMYYWVGVTEAVKKWVKACPACQSRIPSHPSQPAVLFCLVYGCDASSYAFPELSFHRFPKDEKLRKKWLQMAQRDEASLRANSYICSRHFEMSCFSITEEGQLVLSPDAEPTKRPVTVHGNEVPGDSDENFNYCKTWNDELSETPLAAVADQGSHSSNLSEKALQLQEHQYCLPGPAPDSRAALTMNENRRRTTVEPSFITYNHIARYLSTRVLPMQGKRSRSALKRMSKRFSLIDGVLMYTRVSPPLRVPRSREEVNSILQQFHDNQGHFGQGICQRQISKHYHWGSLSRDLASWISSCQTCVNRSKRKMIRCSVSKCTNRCGPVERKLGLIFHRFPLHNVPLLTQWLKACGRGNWHPRLWSSICSAHFTEKCYDSSGEKLTLLPDAVPTLNVHSDTKTQADGLTSTPAAEEAFFAKYNAVELYISRRIYPPGLTYVEKNTFRRFCKRYAIIDGKLHVVTRDQMRLVLRSRQQVETALMDFHNDLNHLNANKCLRLLNERYYWQTMKPDVVQWINNCSQCSVKIRRKPCREAEVERSEMLHSLTSTEDDSHSDGADGFVDIEVDGGDNDEDVESGGRDGIVEEHTLESVEMMSVETPSIPSSSSSPPTNPQPRIPILIHLRTPCQLPSKTSIILQPRIPNSTIVTRLWPQGKTTSVHSDAFNKSEIQSSNQTLRQQPLQPEDTKGMSSTEDGNDLNHFIQEQSTALPLKELHPTPQKIKTLKNNHGQRNKKSRDLQSQHNDKPSVKRKRSEKGDSLTESNSSCGLEPMAAPSSKPWPVFTIANTALAEAAQPPPRVESPLVHQKSKKLQARTIIQQCSRAKVKIRPAVDGADAEWVEIDQGLVVYVCFFHGATEEVTLEMANNFLKAKVFRKDRHTVSVLDLPGNVLLVPQDSLVGESLANRRMHYKEGCEPWRGAQLFSNLVDACRRLMSDSIKCSNEGMKVEHGVYGQKQELIFESLEPQSLLLEF